VSQDALARLRSQLSSLQSLLTLSRLMTDSGDPQRIAGLAGTAVPSLSRCQLVGVMLDRGGWAVAGPAGGHVGAMAELSAVLDGLGPSGGAIAAPGRWSWAYPMRGAAGHAGFLVVAAAEEPPVEERFVLQALAQQTGVAMLNARLQAHERGAAERALAAKREAEGANRAKSEFLSSISHELRTPLNVVLGFGQLLELDDLSEGQRDNVGQIVRAGEHLLGLIDEVLDLSRIESGTLALSPEPVPVGELLTEVLELIRPLAAERQLDLRAPPRQDDLVAVADRQRLRQILLNLCSNAVKYNHHGGTVCIGCQAVGDGRVRITVSDSGPGIPADKLSRLFTPFDRLGAERSEVQGTGLGLALSKRLAEALGGSLTAYSVQGQGTTFAVDLLAAEGALEPGQPVPVAPSEQGPDALPSAT
jgi:signal transduction histidine kinase